MSRKNIDLAEQAHHELLNTNDTIEAQLVNYITHKYNCTANEIPGAGVVDFTFNDPDAAPVSVFTANTSRVYVDGVRQALGAGADYTELPGTGHIVFNAAPAGGTVITADFDQTNTYDWSDLD
jgi:hypothetical protein